MKQSRNCRRIRNNVPPFCHSDRSASGAEESTTWDKEPPQDKTCHLGRFLGSLPFARNDMSGGGSGLYAQGLSLQRPGTAHRPFPTVRLGLIPSAPIVPTMENAVPHLIHRLRAVPLPRRGRFFGAVLGRFPTYFTGRIQINNVSCPIIVNCPLSIVNFFTSPPWCHRKIFPQDMKTLWIKTVKRIEIRIQGYITSRQ